MRWDDETLCVPVSVPHCASAFRRAALQGAVLAWLTACNNAGMLTHSLVESNIGPIAELRDPRGALFWRSAAAQAIALNGNNRAQFQMRFAS